MATTVTTTPVSPATHRPDAHHDAVAHTHGDMDVRGHERTFDGFVKFMAWNAVAVIVLLIFLALAGA